MLFPHTESQRITLTSARAADAGQVYEILFQLGRAGLPMVDTFVEAFGQGLAACFLVRRKDTGEVVGFTSLTELSPAGHVQAEVYVAAGHRDELLVDATMLTANFAFSMWRTRKVYFYTTEKASVALGVDGDHLTMVREEAVLPSHAYFHGRRWDVNVLAIYRDQWDSCGVDLLKQLL
ncbi:hypothetical protein QLQ12_42045 [Actinoplanes sp. NEAU-A12]|uniref:GNAT family N-acetyltransferase n=1 Tax=Actinoplanes sandaracinus TaxID=3045177 RepID=A0ABT6WZL5_9ACTN|nr:hypothetical protein [Actinoplanes sandaracinus]MDI6105188.1 hypothetical protein [Actinoplanes sandaracinus]